MYDTISCWWVSEIIANETVAMIEWNLVENTISVLYVQEQI